MLKNLGRLAILLVVISILATGVVYAVNNSETAGSEPQGAFNPEGFHSGQQADGSQPAIQGDFHGREGSGSFAAAEIWKNLGIMLGITALVVIIEKGITLIKNARKVPAAQP
jgi:hypothetical protein